MKLTSRLLLTLALLVAFAAGACAQGNVRWNADGTKSLTQDGWTLAGTSGDGLTKSQDWSSGQSDSGTNGVWRINDTDLPAAKYMRMYKNPGGIDPSQGIVLARAKFISANALTYGTFGYSSATGNHSVVMCIRDGEINWKTGPGGDMWPDPLRNLDTRGYRVYAIRWYGNGTFDAWYSNTSRWSPNSSNWTQAVSGGYMQGTQTQSAFTDETGTKRDGLLMGNFAASTTTWDGCIDYICWSGNSNELEPWSFDLSSFAPPNDSECTANNILPAMSPGQQLVVSVTFTNWGSNTWTRAAGYKLGAVGDSDPFCAFNRVELDPADSIGYGQSKTFNFTMTAPTPLQIYTTDWQMIQEGGVGWFGGTLTKQVVVMEADSAQYMSDTIPTSMTLAQWYSVSVTMKNTSLNTWTRAGEYKLGAPGDDPFGPARIELDPGDSIGPGQSKTFTFWMSTGALGVFTTDWQMVHENLCWFGDTLSKQVSVDPSPDGLVLNDPMEIGKTKPFARSGGILTSTGWQVQPISEGGENNYLIWHLPWTVTKGAAEFYVTGIDATYYNKTEQWHMYDYTYEDADNNYGGYNGNPYKHFFRKSGTADGAKNGSFEVIMRHSLGEIDRDSWVMSWSKATKYKMRVEWTSGGSLKITRDGAAIGVDEAMGTYAPAGHSVRLGKCRGMGEGAEAGAVYSALKVWDLSGGYVPTATVHWPVNGSTTNSTTVNIHWTGSVHTRYRVRICTVNDPNSSITWDSGDVTSALNYATTGALPSGVNYYVFVKLGNVSQWGPWSATVYWFRVDTSYTPARSGLVRVTGSSLEDDGGKFLGLGFTYMRSMQRCKYDRNRYLSDLAAMASQGFNYQRILSMVSWDGYEIMPISAYNNADPAEWIPAWPDYWQQFRDCIDIAYDNYGIRSEVTIFADAQLCMPNDPDRYTHMNSVLANLVGREHKVIQIEVCNEPFKNGFASVAAVRLFGQWLADRTSMPISNGSWDTDDAGIIAMNAGSGADISTVHFSRDGDWASVMDCWRVANLYTLNPPVPPVSSNEPIGSGSSITSEDHPIHLSSAATFAWIAKLPMYVYHGRAGTSAVSDSGNPVSFEGSAGYTVYKNPVQILPGDLASWTRNDGLEPAAPFSVYCMGQENKYTSDVGGATNGCLKNIGARKPTNPGEFVCYPMGILGGGLTLKARENMKITVYDPLTGSIVLGPVVKTANEQFDLNQGPEAYIIKSTVDTPPPPVTNFTVIADCAQNTLSWTNPTDPNFAGTRILFKTTGYPSGPNDATATVIYDSIGTTYVHSGLTNEVTYYYAAFAHSATLTYSTGANGSGTPVCIPPPGPVTGFKAYGGNQRIDLAWTNPTNPSPIGVRILFKSSGGFPLSPTDPSATVIYDELGTSYSHTGLTNVVKYYYAAYAYTTPTTYSTVAQSSTYAAAEVSIPTMKGLANSVIRSVKGNVVTAVFTGYFYIQDPLNPYGLKVSTTETPLPSIGQKVDVLGYMTGMAGNERSLSCTGNWIRVTDPGPINIVPAALNNKAVGGANLNTYTPGVVGGTGANNVGLLVRVSGKVTQIQSGQYFYVDDGCGLKDGTKTSTIDNVGVRIKVSSIPSGVVAGKYVVVTGIVSPLSAGGLRPQILPRPQPAGVQIVGP